MDYRVKNLWVNALRSRKYHKVESELKAADGEFCALGVLCDLYAKEHPEAEWVTNEYSGVIEGFKAAPRTAVVGSVLPSKVKIWAGLKHSDPKFYFKGEKKEMTELNDAEGLSFNKIADIIESNSKDHT